jgi:hypothetical protein
MVSSPHPGRKDLDQGWFVKTTGTARKRGISRWSDEPRLRTGIDQGDLDWITVDAVKQGFAGKPNAWRESPAPESSYARVRGGDCGLFGMEERYWRCQTSIVVRVVKKSSFGFKAPLFTRTFCKPLI